MNIVFLLSYLQGMNREKDTSLALILSAHRKGHKIYYLSNGGILRKNNKIFFRVSKIVPHPKNPQDAQIFQEVKDILLDEDNVDIIFIRADPPFDDQYLLNTWLLDLLPKRVKIINNPSGIRSANEKIWAMQFPSIIPPTLVGQNKKDMLDFLSEEKDIVAKPTNGFGGQSVFHIKSGDSNAHVIIETLSQNGTRDIILQKFIPESQQGDKRILLLNGEPLGAVLRVHAKDDHRNNFFTGGKAVATEMNKRDNEIISILKPELRKLGLYFVGIDIMGDYLIEVNVTSPTCLQEMNRLYDLRLEDKVVEFAENML